MSDVAVVVLFCAAYVSLVIFYTSYVVGHNISRRGRKARSTLNSLFD